MVDAKRQAAGYKGGTRMRNSSPQCPVCGKWLTARAQKPHPCSVAATRMRDQIVERVKAKAEEYRAQGERWQQQSQNETSTAIKELDYSDRDACLNKMQAAFVIVTEIEGMNLDE